MPRESVSSARASADGAGTGCSSAAGVQARISGGAPGVPASRSAVSAASRSQAVSKAAAPDASSSAGASGSPRMRKSAAAGTPFFPPKISREKNTPSSASTSTRPRFFPTSSVSGVSARSSRAKAAPQAAALTPVMKSAV